MLFGGKAWMIGGRTGRYGAMPIRFTRALRERSLLPYLFRGKRPEVVHLGASDFTLLGNFYFGNSRRMKGKMRSTPTPFDIFLTVNVAPSPAPRLPITTP